MIRMKEELTLYFVNRSDIEKKISHIDYLLEELDRQAEFTSQMEKLALERAIHVMIEALLDVGNHMIDGFIMRDPGSYHDIIDILIDEKVLEEKEENQYKALIDLRQMLVQAYLEIDHEELANVIKTNMETYKNFSSKIRAYLDNELGVANAFSNEP